MMAKPLVVFGDATAAVIDLLGERLAARVESFTDGVALGSRVPRNRSTDVPHLPFVLVALDATSDIQYPINAVATIRVTVWHVSDAAAHDLAQLCQGLLLTYPGGDVLRGIRPGLGILPAVDPGSGVALASLTVLANVRALPLG